MDEAFMVADVMGDFGLDYEHGGRISVVLELTMAAAPEAQLASER
jgi:hypothetical protein